MVHSEITELSDFVRAYETVQEQDGWAPVEKFLPEPGHPLYLRVLRELVCVDLAYGWKRRRPQRLALYQFLFPELFRDREALQEVALREYRLRQEAGERPTPLEYQRTFGVDTADWPAETPNGPPAQEGCGYPGPGEPDANPLAGENGLLEVATSYQEIRLQNPDNLDSWCESFRGRPEHAGLFREVHSSSPEAADRLAQGVIAMPEVGTEFLGFRLLQDLGKGAFARVYLCQQGELANRYVVLKVSLRIDTESQTLAQLQHTNVVPIYSVHQAGALQAVCMPYFGSTTLATVLNDLQGRESLPASGKGLISTLVDRKKTTRQTASSKVEPTQRLRRGSQPAPAMVTNGVEKPEDPLAAPPTVGSTSILEMLEGLSFAEAILWMTARLADGLAHAHERGILHRDLKPANVLITDEGQPMLLDFNLAQDTKLLSHPSAALIGGTLPFMAPEQLEGYRTEKNCADRRSDLYSLGIILYELLTGQHLFEAHSGPLPEVLTLMVADRLQSPPRVRQWNKAVSPAVEAIVRRCLEPDPAKRYQTARELQEDLERQLEHRPLKHTPEPSWRERARKWVRRHPRLTSSTSVALVAAVLVVVLGCSLAFGLERLGRLEAMDSLGRFQEEMRTAQFLLTTRAADAEQLEAGIRTARQALDRYHALDNPSWQNLAAVRRLPEEDRSKLREDVGELLVLLAQAATVQAAGHPDSRLQEDQLRLALSLNERAEKSCGPDQASRALLLQRAELAGLLGQDADAERLREKANQIPLRTAADQYLVATEHIAHRRFREAVPYLQEATRLDPEHFWAWFTLGSCYDNLAQDADALACYSASMGLRPKFPWSYFNRGLVYLRQQNLKQAAADFDQVIQLKSETFDAYLNRAVAHQGLGNYQGAIDDLTKAHDPGATYTRVSL